MGQSLLSDGAPFVGCPLQKYLRHLLFYLLGTKLRRYYLPGPLVSFAEHSVIPDSFLCVEVLLFYFFKKVLEVLLSFAVFVSHLEGGSLWWEGRVQISQRKKEKMRVLRISDTRGSVRADVLLLVCPTGSVWELCHPTCT